MTQHIPIYASHSHDIIAHALVDDDDHERVAGHHWVMQGDTDSPRYVYRYRSCRERKGDEPTTIGLAPDCLTIPIAVDGRPAKRAISRFSSAPSPFCTP